MTEIVFERGTSEKPGESIAAVVVGGNEEADTKTEDEEDKHTEAGGESESDGGEDDSRGETLD